jgi:sugar lactone lactonase YvrE
VAEPVGDLVYTATSGVSPVQVAAFDPVQHRVTTTIDLPTGAGTWAMAHVGTDLYVATYDPGDLYRIDTTTGTATKVANFGSFVWAIAAAPDGTIVAGTYPDAGVWSYDPATGQTRKYGTAVAGEQYVRSIAVTDTTIFAGVGAHAHLIAIDRATGERTDVLPAQYANRTFVATLALSGDTLAAGLSPTGTMLVFSLDDLAHPVEVQADPAEQYVTAITVHGDSVYLGTRPAGVLWRYDTASGTVTRLGSPYDGAYFNRIMVSADDAVTAELTSTFVDYDAASGTFDGTDLTAAGLPPAPELAMQVTATDDRVLVSGKAGVQVHDLATGASHRTFLAGEAKTMTPVGGQVYLGVYTLARLFSVAPDGTDLHKVGDVANEQTRPTDAVYDPAVGKLLVTTEADYGKYNGALACFDPRTGAVRVYRGVVPNQSVRSVAATGGTAYLGSEIRNSLGTDPIVKEATLSAFDLRRGTVRWQVTPVPGAGQLTDLALWRGTLYGTTDTGTLFAFDPGTRTVLSTVDVGAGATLVTARGHLYGATGGRIFRVNGDGTTTTVLDDLAAETYGPPMLAPAPDGRSLYTVRHRNLIRLWL